MSTHAPAKPSQDEKTAIMYITEKCNQACVFCLEENETWQGERTIVDPGLQLVMKDLEDMRAVGCNHVTFMGGETLNRRDFEGVVVRAKELGFTRIGVATNGVSSAKTGFLKKLQSAGLNFVEISIHAVDDELVKVITGRGFTWERQQKALSQLEELGPDFVTIVNIVINRYNRDHIPTLVRELTSRWDLNWILKFKAVNLVGSAALDHKVGYRHDELDLTDVFDALQEKGIDFWTSNMPLCRLAQRHRPHASESQGMVVDRVYMTYDHKGQSGYFNSGFQRYGVQPAACEGCTLRGLCPGIEEQYFRTHGDGELTPQTQDPVALAAALFQAQDLPVPGADAMKKLFENMALPESRHMGPKQEPQAHRLTLTLDGEDHPRVYLDFYRAGTEGPSWLETARFRTVLQGHEGGAPMLDPTLRRLLRLLREALPTLDGKDAKDPELLQHLTERITKLPGVSAAFTQATATLPKRGR